MTLWFLALPSLSLHPSTFFPYIVELSFMGTQKSHDSINEGPSLTTEGPPQTNVVYVPMEHLGQNLGLISNYILPITVIYLVAWHSYTNLHNFV